MLSFNIPDFAPDPPPTPSAIDRPIKALCGDILSKRRRIAGLEQKSAPLRVSRDVISAPASNFVSAGREVCRVAA